MPVAVRRPTGLRTGHRCRSRPATAPNRPTLKPVAVPARSDSSARAAASIARTPRVFVALEEHIHSLQADRETARVMRAADYVIANMHRDRRVHPGGPLTMRRRLAELGPQQRAEVEESSRILRRARAARRIPLIATTAKETG